LISIKILGIKIVCSVVSFNPGCRGGVDGVVYWLEL